MIAADDNETDVRKLFEELAEATRRKDLARVMACYHPSVIAYDLMPPLTHEGAAEYREVWRSAFGSMEGPFTVEYRDLEVRAGRDVAFVFGLERCQGIAKKNGVPIDTWSRMTAGLQKFEGAWKIVHQHDSVPIDMEHDKPVWARPEFE